MAPPFTLITHTGRENYPESNGLRCAYMCTIMAEFHNALFRALNSSYEHSYHIRTPSSGRDLRAYGAAICNMIAEHHDWEENSYFPALENLVGKPGLLQGNVDQHKEFEGPLHKFDEYCKEENGEEFDGEKFRQLINAFAPPLQRHMTQEPETFFKLRDVDNAEVERVYAEQVKVTMQKADLWLIVPLLLGSLDRDFKVDGLEQLHELPAIFPWLTYLVFSWRHHRLWKFNASTYWGKAKKVHAE